MLLHKLTKLKDQSCRCFNITTSVSCTARLINAIFLLFSVFILSSCGSGGDSVSISSISISPSSVQLATIGESVSLTATALDANGTALTTQPSFSWQSKDDAIASVDQTGSVTAVTDGQTMVTVSSGGVQQVVNVSVNVLMSSITITPDPVVLVTANETVSLAATLLNSEGVALSATATYVWSSSDESVATVDSNGIVTAIANGQVTITAVSGNVSGSITISVGIGGFALTGTVRYEDKQYSPNGFTGKTNDFKFVRNAKVELVNALGTIVDSTTTNNQGTYAFAVLQEISTVRVLAETDPNTGTEILINNLTGALYAVSKGVNLDSTTVTENIDIPLSNDASGAFNIFDVFLIATTFVNSLSTNALLPLNAFWTAQSSQYGTYYCTAVDSAFCPRGAGVYIFGGGAFSLDTDEYDDDVLWHEFSHYIEHSLGTNDSPGGAHLLTSNDLDLRLAWSEGWGNFLPGAIKTWLKAIDPQKLSSLLSMGSSYYIDTVGSIAAISFEMGAPDPQLCPGGIIDCFIYSSNEVAVAKVMWELQNTVGMNAVWSVYKNYLGNLAVSDPVVSLETFWDGWLATHMPNPQELASLELVFNERLVFYQEDGFEVSSDDFISVNRKFAVCGIVSCTGETHYLYKDNGNSDNDHIGFDVTAGTTYVVETYNLSNGADTFISLFDAGGNAVLDGNSLPIENDDRSTMGCNNITNCDNGPLTFSSSITFTPSVTGTFFIDVLTSPNVWPMSGRYGTYLLRIIQQ